MRRHGLKGESSQHEWKEALEDNLEKQRLHPEDMQARDKWKERTTLNLDMEQSLGR